MKGNSGWILGGFGGGGFGSDPFFGGWGFGGGLGGGDPFASMHQSMLSSTSSFPGMGMGMAGNMPPMGSSSSVSTSTTTQIINGRRQTITETVIQKPDGTVERHVQTDGNDPMMNNNQARLMEQQQQQFPDNDQPMDNDNEDDEQCL